MRRGPVARKIPPMPRHPRVHATGLVYHLMARGNNGYTIFRDRTDYHLFLKALDTAKRRYPFALYAYALLPNHFHLLIETRDSPTGRIMQSMLTRYSRYFNDRYRRRGHVFQGRYRAIVCERESYLLELVRYIHLNPVRAKLVTRPDDWPWTGHREYLGRAAAGLIDSGPITGLLATRPAYERFVRDGVNEGYRSEWHPGETSPFLGSQDFVQTLSRRPDAKPPSRPAQSLDALLIEEAARCGLSREAIRHGGRRPRVVAARDRFIARAAGAEGHSASAIAKFLSCHPSVITKSLHRTSSDT